MFDQMKQAAKMASMLKDLPRIKARMGSVKEELAGRVVEGTAGGGAVTATVDGRLRLTAVRCSPALLVGLADPAGRAAAEGLIVEAVNDAMARAQAMIAEALHRAAAEMDLPIPEGMLDGLMR